MELNFTPSGKEEAKGPKTPDSRTSVQWDLALVLPINLGDQGIRGSMGMHTLVVSGGMRPLRIATKTFWTIVNRIGWQNSTIPARHMG